MDVRSQLNKKEDKIRAYYSRILNSTTDSKVISNYARKSYKIQRSRKASKGGPHVRKDDKVDGKGTQKASSQPPKDQL
jgi:hypothetical protein